MRHFVSAIEAPARRGTAAPAARKHLSRHHPPVTSDDLQTLLSRAIADPRQEDAFFAAMLGARLFAHSPLSDDSRRVRLLQFTRPDGMTVLPIFTSHEKAQFAAQSGARVLEFVGRELLEVTRGAVVMIDPNDESCPLFPEEVASLLQFGRLPTVESFTASEDGPYRIAGAAAAPQSLVETLTRILGDLPYVNAGYLFQRIENATLPTFLLAIDVDADMEERAAKACAAGMQSTLVFEGSIDVMTYKRELPSYLRALECMPIFVRV